jgi:hypothetical protein
MRSGFIVRYYSIGQQISRMFPLFLCGSPASPANDLKILKLIEKIQRFNQKLTGTQAEQIFGLMLCALVGCPSV